MCGPATMRAIRRRSGSNLRTRTPDHRGRRRAGGKLDRADGRFIEAAKAAGETPFLAQYTCGPGRSPHIKAQPRRLPDPTRRNGMARRNPPRKVTYFEPVAPRLARNTIIESTFEVGRRFRCTMRIDCGQLDPGAVIRPDPGEWHPRMPERLDDEELADWRAGRNAVYQLAALTVGARLAVADA